MEKKTSKLWYDEIYPADENGKRALTIYDPDGWDRKNWEYSFEQEEIDEEEFHRRVMFSTCMVSKSLMKQWEETNKKVSNV